MSINSKRPRVAPYEKYQQPRLYESMYQDNDGGDRSIHVSAVMGNQSPEANADFDMLQIDTSKWPQAYDGKTHKCIYNVTQIMIGARTEDAETASTVNGKAFGAGTQEHPYALMVQLNGPNNGATQVCKKFGSGNVFNTDQYHQLIAAFPPYASAYTVRQHTSGAESNSKFTYNQVEKVYPPGACTFSGSYPPPPIMKFAFMNLTNDPGAYNQYMKMSNGTIVYLQFLISLLD